MQSITDKRPKTVIDHILKHGHITTDELKVQYGYNHPPRAARDVRESGYSAGDVFVVDGLMDERSPHTRFADPVNVKFRQFDGPDRPIEGDQGQVD